MSECCGLVVQSEPTAQVIQVTTPTGTLVTDDGAVVVVSQLVAHIVTDSSTVVHLAILPLIYQVYPENQVAYAKRVDFDDDNDYIYRGEAVPGSAEDNFVWRVSRITFVGADEDVVQEWASGDANFDKRWTDRLSLSYS